MFNPDYPARLRELVGHCRRAAEHSYELEAKAALRTIGEHLSKHGRGNRAARQLKRRRVFARKALARPSRRPPVRSGILRGGLAVDGFDRRAKGIVFGDCFLKGRHRCILEGKVPSSVSMSGLRRTHHDASPYRRSSSSGTSPSARGHSGYDLGENSGAVDSSLRLLRRSKETDRRRCPTRVSLSNLRDAGRGKLVPRIRHVEDPGLIARRPGAFAIARHAGRVCGSRWSFAFRANVGNDVLFRRRRLPYTIAGARVQLLDRDRGAVHRHPLGDRRRYLDALLLGDLRRAGPWRGRPTSSPC